MATDSTDRQLVWVALPAFAMGIRNDGHAAHDGRRVGSRDVGSRRRGLGAPGQYRDPVCGMRTDEEEPTPTHDGDTYHFCSRSCKRAFQGTPAEFTGIELVASETMSGGRDHHRLNDGRIAAEQSTNVRRCRIHDATVELSPGYGD